MFLNFIDDFFYFFRLKYELCGWLVIPAPKTTGTFIYIKSKKKEIEKYIKNNSLFILSSVCIL